ncbi:wall-associated receptor kinase 2-like [Primulina huaijiensis]|uniref:wall-associated receptor kinase 2-like n=1 Tax=Primulina huaijiensis TaxID=1492673 RepID=UPI003CC71E66
MKSMFCLTSQIQFFDLHRTRFLLKMAIFPLLFLVLRLSSAQQPSYPIAKSNCLDRCGDIEIPYPFGTTEVCYQARSFWVICNQTFDPPKLFMQNSAIEILNISLDGQLRILQFIAHDCYAVNGTRTTRISNNEPWLRLPTNITVNNTHNKFTIVGCDTNGFVSGLRLNSLNRKYKTGCTAICYAEDDLEQGSCSGVGCCQTSIPKQVRRVELTLGSYDNYSLVKDFNNCSHAFLVEETSFSFSPENLTNLNSVEKLPMVADWAIGNETCQQAMMDSFSYACKSHDSECYKPDNGNGYRCSCKSGYRGNPYLIDGCKDINECNDPNLNKCEKQQFCRNTDGNFTCVCPKGYHGDGRKEGKGCVRGESVISRLVAGIALGVVILLLSACLLYLELKRRSSIKMKQQYFIRNGGHLLQEKLSKREREKLSKRGGSPDTVARLYSYSELQKATNNFHDSVIIGRGGFGTVYKGFLPDNSIVAIKKSKQVDPNQVEQFVNEVYVLSQINHTNVVKLRGCCLDTEAPLLVYEFISNGTLSEHIHDQAKARFLDWDIRLRIATETAGVLSYLHSAASPPIVHRDIKPANILLDDNLTAKVADFGASRLVPVDQTQLSTMVQGTFGYLDPEYMQTNQLTAKSDVYSFGVVLVELLTGRKALSYDKPDLEKNLAHLFLYKLKQGLLSEILDDNILSKANSVQLTKVARLAEGCLHVKGDDRPNMKEVAMELEGLRTGVQAHSWALTKHNVEEMESLLREGSNYPFFNANGTDSSTSNTYDSLRDHIILSMRTDGR